MQGYESVPGYNDLQWATQDTAKKIADLLGGKVVMQPGPASGPFMWPGQRMIQLGNAPPMNAGILASNLQQWGPERFRAVTNAGLAHTPGAPVIPPLAQTSRNTQTPPSTTGSQVQPNTPRRGAGQGIDWGAGWSMGLSPVVGQFPFMPGAQDPYTQALWRKYIASNVQPQYLTYYGGGNYGNP